jgi:hypothetical protein
MHLPGQAGMEDVVFAQPPFAFGRFLGQDMAMKRLVAANFSFCRLAESLSRSSVTFHFWHCRIPYMSPINDTNLLSPLQKKSPYVHI